MTFPDLIFVSLENWDEVWRRNQFLCSGLARRFPDSKILFVGMPRDLSNAVRKRDFSALGDSQTRSVRGFPNITLTRPLKVAPNTLASGRRLNERLFRTHVKRVAGRMGLSKPLLWLNPHDAVHMAGRMGECAVLYDITDDWALAPFNQNQKTLIEEQDRRLCRAADLVVVCSQALQKSRQGFSKRILLLPNGVDVAHYTDANSPQSTLNARASLSVATPADSKAPVFGYTGTLHEDRVDAALTVALARAFPAGRIELVGPDNLDTNSRALLAEQPNIQLRGPVPYARIAEVMRAFDVCIVPHRESAFTESLNPIKLWEYLACGKPIVSTNVAGFRDYPQFVHLASGAEAFITACRTALREDTSLGQARRAEAAQHSWDARIEDLLQAMEPLKVL
jgi:teichuronic acid biosynthesis glycosyltransferase TuaH